MNHVMSPTGVAVLLMLALVVDYLSVGPDSIRDRLAFLMALPAIREGFDGSPLDTWTVGALSGGIDMLKQAAAGAYIAGAITSFVLGAGIIVLGIYTVGALLPDKASKRLGRFATIHLPKSALHRINYKLWLCAALLGMLADLAGGSAGNILRGAIDLTAKFASLVPGFFGVA
jgi:hypothetical protein